MKKIGITALAVFLLVLIPFRPRAAENDFYRIKNFYRPFEIIAVTQNDLTLEDEDGNVIEVNKDSGDYKVGYKVLYDSVRKRLRPYRWQDYEVIAISDNSITLQHKTGDILSVEGNYRGKFDIGDPVRYDSISHQVQRDEGFENWKQYTVIAAERDKIILQSKEGQQITLHNVNNQFPGIFLGLYKVGDLVRYNATINKLRKGVIRTYDWQEYEVKEVNSAQIVLRDKTGKDLVLKNVYNLQLAPGDAVKYDRINNMLKKSR